MLKNLLQRFSLDRKAIFVILLGTIIWFLTMAKSGLVYDFGMGFWGPNGHDGVWHISVIESLARGSFEMPVFSGVPLTNYHIGFDLVVAFLHVVTRVSVVTLYFQVVPLILAFLIGLLTYKFVCLWKKSKTMAFWSTFFVYFGTGWGWLISFIRSGEIGGESMFWSQQAISTLINPPFAMSLVILLFGLIFLQKNKNPKNTKQYLLPILLFGILVQFKVYAGVLALGGLFVSGLVKNNKHLLKIFLGALFISLLVFIPMNSGGANLLVWKPFWFLETMMGLSDRLGWDRFYSAMTNYKLGGNWPKEILAYTSAFLIFWFGNLGVRVIGVPNLFGWIKNLKKNSWVEVFILSVISGGTLIPMFILQKGTPWNTIQFFYYSLFFLAIVAGIAFTDFLEKAKKGFSRSFIVAIVLLLTLPAIPGTLRHYLPKRPPAMLSVSELEALSFLSGQPEGVVLTYPYNEIAAKEAEVNPPRPLYFYESTAYVSAFGKQPVYIEDEVNLNITGYDWPTRRESVTSFLETLEEVEAKRFLEENNISYIYWVGDQRAKLGEEQLGLELIFENKEVKIYKVLQVSDAPDVF